MRNKCEEIRNSMELHVAFTIVQMTDFLRDMKNDQNGTFFIAGWTPVSVAEHRRTQCDKFTRVIKTVSISPSNCQSYNSFAFREKKTTEFILQKEFLMRRLKWRFFSFAEPQLSLKKITFLDKLKDFANLISIKSNVAFKGTFGNGFFTENDFGDRSDRG